MHQTDNNIITAILARLRIISNFSKLFDSRLYWLANNRMFLLQCSYFQAEWFCLRVCRETSGRDDGRTCVEERHDKFWKESRKREIIISLFRRLCFPDESGKMKNVSLCGRIQDFISWWNIYSWSNFSHKYWNLYLKRILYLYFLCMHILK